jgi:hypothetical protein
LSITVWLEHGSAVPEQLPPHKHPAAPQALPSLRVVQSGAVPPQVPVPVAQRHPVSLLQDALSVRLGHVASVPLHTPEPGDQ